MNQTTPPLQCGQRVRKIGGDYQLEGTVVAAFTKSSGAHRYVVEAAVPVGLLHIYGPANLEAMPLPPEAMLQVAPPASQDATIDNMRGRERVLIDLLREALQVVDTAEGETQPESEELSDLAANIRRAIEQADRERAEPFTTIFGTDRRNT